MPINNHIFREEEKQRERTNSGLFPLLSLKEASDYLGFKTSYLYKLTHLHKIPFFKPLGGKLLFSKKELEQWVINSRINSERGGTNE